MCENKLNLGHSLRMLFALSILLALLAACGDESSSSAQYLFSIPQEVDGEKFIMDFQKAAHNPA